MRWVGGGRHPDPLQARRGLVKSPCSSARQYIAKVWQRRIVRLIDSAAKLRFKRDLRLVELQSPLFPGDLAPTFVKQRKQNERFKEYGLKQGALVKSS